MDDLIPALQTPTAPAGTGRVRSGMPVSRVDGRAKVTGSARYAAEIHAPGLCHGVVVSGMIAKGRITHIDPSDALAVPGVIDVLTHRHRPPLAGDDEEYKDSTAPDGAPFRPLYNDRILYSGQPVALVLAETFEAARYAASLVTVDYEAEAHATDLLAGLNDAHDASETTNESKGDADAVFARAPVKVDAQYYNEVEHHNPMELFASTVVYGDDGHLTIYDKTQGSQNCHEYICGALQLPPERVTVRNPYVGGAFGSGLRPQYQLPLATMAALHLKRSVRVVLTRQQMFFFGHRPEVWQRVKLAANPDGQLQAIVHEARQETSSFEDYTEEVVNWSGQLYACENIRLGHKLVARDRPTPVDMRAPGATHGVHALEVAMDELSYALGMDPLALRLKNYAERNPLDGKPYSSKELRACYERGAERFGWSRRPPQPRSMQEGAELVGYGMASAIWEAFVKEAEARAVLHADGRLVVSSAASDIGTGTYTVMTMIAAEAMGLPMEQVTFQLGDSNLPKAPTEGGSSHVNSVGSAIFGACDHLKRELWEYAREQEKSAFAQASFEDVEFGDGQLRLRGGATVAIADLLRAKGKDHIEATYQLSPPKDKQEQYARLVHAAVFCEVRVNEALGIARVTRVVDAVAAGRIISAKTAASQVSGGVIWGISQALHEATYTDHDLGRFMNHNYAEYHVPVCADIHDIEVIFVDEEDRIVSAQLGTKGVGEIGILGVAAAVSNAIYHATGKRIRSTPITPDKLLLGDRDLPVPNAPGGA
ncbi:xanthine dehydrogenase family protein molybdopterin-binding subunit [Massilia arenosa]|uniref:Xanthine dehydrogenase family protein molybdopterin-binding subunit n=1 Tax=Zemynaea arenosa TaxID=2561931 RepID=A0A4Y9SDV9_9BURK|nr:xanthine dehydrogenase family protein molybdopterin-binding subunit [Massilia arenosa]TFW21042.1 xanthine dehydrogenase family protein molybdopterin-binding subunit [Massilia arenosa]